MLLQWGGMKYAETTVNEMLTTLFVDINNGLTESQVSEYKQKYGSNTLTTQREATIFERILRELLNPLVLILVAALVLTIILKEHIDSIVIFIAIVVNVTVSLFQEGKANNAFKLLQQKRIHSALVIRDGKKREIPLEEVVVGDVLLVQSGMYVPADARIVEAQNVNANQVLFTGEAAPVSKSTDPSTSEFTFDATSMIFAGSTIASGTGRAVVTAVGKDTEFAKIADSLRTVEKAESPVEQESKKIAHILSIVAAITVVLILAIGFVRGIEFYELLLIAVAVAVSAVPEGLPSVVTAILAYGAGRIGAQGGLVKNLSSAQTLGSTELIMTDKTGTLTYGHMEIDELVMFSQEKDKHMLLDYALFATEMFYDDTRKGFVGDDVDTAIGRFEIRGGAFVNSVFESYPVRSTIPFDSRYKFFSALREHDGKTTLYTKGAFEVIWEACDSVHTGTTELAKTLEQYHYFKRIIDQASDAGKRIIAVAYKDESIGDITQATDNQESYIVGSTFVGILVMSDKVRESAKAAVLEARDADVKVIMITGDAPRTAAYIAYQTGITDTPDALVIQGSELEKISDQTLFDRIMDGSARVFSRVSPDQKLRLATLFTSRGVVIAMTGDGVNDAPALSKASIGISLASATDVAKESADLILTNNSFDVIVHAIKEGRRIASNISKTVIYLLSTSLAEVVVIIGAIIAGLSIPFLPTQILWANILVEGIMNFAYLFEHEKTAKKSPTRILDKRVISLTLVAAVVSGILYLTLFFGLSWGTNLSEEMVRTVMFGALISGALLTAFGLKSLEKPFWEVNPFENKFFLYGFLLNIALFFATFKTEFGQMVFKIENLSSEFMVFLLVFGVINLLGIEILKSIIWRPAKTNLAIT